jgi:hypothetical protein
VRNPWADRQIEILRQISGGAHLESPPQRVEQPQGRDASLVKFAPGSHKNCSLTLRGEAHPVGNSQILQDANNKRLPNISARRSIARQRTVCLNLTPAPDRFHRIGRHNQGPVRRWRKT